MRGCRPWIVVSLVLWAVLAVAFIFLDEAISEALIDQRSGWAGALELYGQVPGGLVGVIGGAVLYRLPRGSTGVRALLSNIGIFFLLAYYSFGVAADLTGVQARGDEADQVLVIALTVASMAAAVLLPAAVPRGRLERFRPAAQVAFVLPVVAAVVTVWAIKIPWGRWTPRDIIEAGDPSLFTPWFLPQGPNGHFAFISGHTAYAFAVLPLAYFFSRTRRMFDVALVLALAWGLLGALSRVVIGAHSPSDTLFAAGFTITWVVILSRRFGADRLVPE